MKLLKNQWYKKSLKGNQEKKKHNTKWNCSFQKAMIRMSTMFS